MILKSPSRPIWSSNSPSRWKSSRPQIGIPCSSILPLPLKSPISSIGRLAWRATSSFAYMLMEPVFKSSRVMDKSASSSTFCSCVIASFAEAVYFSINAMLPEKVISGTRSSPFLINLIVASILLSVMSCTTSFDIDRDTSIALSPSGTSPHMKVPFVVNLWSSQSPSTRLIEPDADMLLPVVHGITISTVTEPLMASPIASWTVPVAFILNSKSPPFFTVTAVETVSFGSPTEPGI